MRFEVHPANAAEFDTGLATSAVWAIWDKIDEIYVHITWAGPEAAEVIRGYNEDRARAQGEKDAE